MPLLLYRAARPLLFTSLLLATLCLPVFFYLRGPALDTVFSSDLQLPASQHWNLLHRPWGWFTFQQPRVDSLFPDQFVYHLLAFVLADPRQVTLTYAVISLGAFYALGGLCAARLAQTAVLPSALAVAALFNVAATAAHLTGRTYIAYDLMMMPVTHSGPFLMSLGLFLLRGRRRAEMIIAFAGCVCDPLFLVYGVIPLLGSAVLAERPASLRALEAAASPHLRTLIIALAGYLLPGLMFIQKTYNQTFAEWSANDALMWHDLLRPEINAIMLVPALAYLGLLAARAWRGRLDAGRLFIMTALAAPIPLFVYFYHDDTCVRYLLPLYVWPLIALAAALVRAFRTVVTIVAALSLAAGSAMAAAAGQFAAPILSWRLPIEACIDRLAPEAGLRAGLAAYDLARPVSVSSGFRRQVEQVNVIGQPYLWGNDPYWYTHDIARPAEPAPFNFIVMAKLHSPSILAAYGAPDRTYGCPGSEIWVYDRPGHVLDILVAASATGNVDLRRDANNHAVSAR